METVGERIKAVRKNAKMTQPQFADLLGLTHASISQFETGKNGASNSTITAICRIFHVNKQWMETGEGDMYDTSKDVLIPDLTDVLSDNPSVLKLISAIAEHMTYEDWKRLNDFIETLGVK